MTRYDFLQVPTPHSQVYLHPYPSFLGVFKARLSMVLLNLLFPISIREFFLSKIYLSPCFFNFSLLLVSSHHDLIMFMFPQTWKITNKTPTILHASSSYHSIFFLLFLSRFLESFPFSLATAVLFIQSSIAYDLASAPTDPQKLLILKSPMTSSLLKPADSRFFLTWFLWDIWHHCLLCFLKSSFLTSCTCVDILPVGCRYSDDSQIISPAQPSPWNFWP